MFVNAIGERAVQLIAVLDVPSIAVVCSLGISKQLPYLNTASRKYTAEDSCLQSLSTDGSQTGKQAWGGDEVATKPLAAGRFLDHVELITYLEWEVGRV
jgi:hypothetical protein